MTIENTASLNLKKLWYFSVVYLFKGGIYLFLLSFTVVRCMVVFVDNHLSPGSGC